MGLTDTSPRAAAPDATTRTAFLVVGTASVPDGRLLAAVRYAGENLSPEAAVGAPRAEAEPIPVTFQVPVGVCVLRIGPDFTLLNFKCLDAPHFRPREIVNQFWFGATHYKAKLVTFNGRGFDLPLLELAAFRYGIAARDHYLARDRYRGPIDLTDWFTNFGACRLSGGLDLLAKLLGKPGPTAAPSGAHRPALSRGEVYRDQRRLPQRHPGHVLRVPADARPDGRHRPGSGDGAGGPGKGVARGEGGRVPRAPPLPRHLDRLRAGVNRVRFGFSPGRATDGSPG